MVLEGLNVAKAHVRFHALYNGGNVQRVGLYIRELRNNYFILLRNFQISKELGNK